MRPNMWRAVIPCASLITVPLVAACGATSTPAVANVASAPKTAAPTHTPAPTATPVPGPPIGDACVVGTWTVVKGTFAVAFDTKQGAMRVPASGGAGMVEHLFSNGTAVEELGGTAFTGSGHGYRVVVRTRGELRSPVVFLNGYETIEPIDLSNAHATISINGGPTQTLPLATYGVLSYTCSATSLTEDDGNGTVYTYHRTSTSP